MPLPADGSSIAWPPRQIAKSLPKMHEWATWYGNDPAALASHYASAGQSVAPRPSQLRGGVVGTVARWFWGTPTAIGQQRAKLHIPIASDIATASADLLFSEAVKVTPDPAMPPEAAGRLEAILDGMAWDSFLPEQAEVSAALGGVYHRVVWDQTLADHPFATAVHADCAWPEFQFGRLRACTFWDVAYQQDNRVVRLLERHELGRIEYGLFDGTADKLGRRIDFGLLTDLGLTAPNLDGSSDGVSIETGPGVPLTATYVPNLRPTRGDWRLDPVLCNLGRSDLDGIEPLLDAADETMTSWLRDLRLGKARILVPETMLQASGREGGGSFFNVDQEVFVGLNAMIDAAEGTARNITAQQFELRTAQHAETLAGILAAAFRGAGYSQQTFGLAGEGEGMATATEVNARESRSNRTREKKSRYYTDALPRTLAALVAIDEVHFGGAARASGWRPSVAFPDATRPDGETEARTLQLLRAAQAVSILTTVKRAQPDLDDQAALLEVQRIIDEEKASQPALSALPDLGPLPGDPNAGADLTPPGA